MLVAAAIVREGKLTAAPRIKEKNSAWPARWLCAKLVAGFFFLSPKTITYIDPRITGVDVSLEPGMALPGNHGYTAWGPV